MPSVDETLRRAFAERDEEWVRRTGSARVAVRTRRRRQQVVRGGLAAAAVGGIAVAAALVLGGPPPSSRTQEPVAPPPTTSTPSVPVTPLDGTWTSRVLDASDVRAAARRSGAPEAATYMLDQLGDAPFRLTLLLERGSLWTSITPVGGVEQPLDQETFEVDGDTLTVTPLTFGWKTEHTWTFEGDRLRMRFVSTTETMTGGVPGEAWQRLLYDTATFTRSQ